MELTQVRAEIDRVDAQLAALIAERMALSGQVAGAKREQGLPVFDAAREAEVLTRAGERAGVHALAVQNVYQALMSESRALQYSLAGGDAAPGGEGLAARLAQALEAAPEAFPAGSAVAVQGAPGAWAQQACDRLFSRAEHVYCRTFEAVFQAVESGLCSFGVLPIENSTYGAVTAVFDLMQRHRFSIVRSVCLHVDHVLLGIPGASLEGLREILSHEQAIGQCSHFLAAHPGIAVTRAENTATAAARVAEMGRPEAAAIASRSCAELYGLQVLKTGIQNTQNNHTRFICIARDLAIYPGADRISLLFEAPHRPGALARALSGFASLQLNITKLESRPIPGSDFAFLFYLDAQASIARPAVRAMLDALAAGSKRFTFLGAYATV